MCFENGLPRQSADWLAMTGFFDSLRETAFGRFSLCAKSALHGVLADGKHAPLSILTKNVSPAEKQQARLRRSPRRSVKLCVRRGQKSNG